MDVWYLAEKLFKFLHLLFKMASVLFSTQTDPRAEVVFYFDMGYKEFNAAPSVFYQYGCILIREPYFWPGLGLNKISEISEHYFWFTPLENMISGPPL